DSRHGRSGRGEDQLADLPRRPRAGRAPRRAAVPAPPPARRRDARAPGALAPRRLAAQQVYAPFELADHRVHLSEAVAEHDLVGGLAEARAIPLGLPQQPRSIKQLSPDLARALL